MNDAKVATSNSADCYCWRRQTKAQWLELVSCSWRCCCLVLQSISVYDHEGSSTGSAKAVHPWDLVTLQESADEI